VNAGMTRRGSRAAREPVAVHRLVMLLSHHFEIFLVSPTSSRQALDEVKVPYVYPLASPLQELDTLIRIQHRNNCRFGRWLSAKVHWALYDIIRSFAVPVIQAFVVR
jgi:hypothetical protein